MKRLSPRTLLAVYWTAAFVVTHLPPFLPKDEDDGPDPLVGPDKVVHFVGFAILAWLLVRVLPERWPLAWRNAATVGICAAYGVFDELTQPPFGRTADANDFLADMLGVAAGLLVFRLRSGSIASKSDAS